MLQQKVRASGSFLAVEQMRQGATPTEAAQTAIDRIASKYPSFVGAIIAVNTNGTIGAACNGLESFPYSYMDDTTDSPVVEYVTC